MNKWWWWAAAAVAAAGAVAWYRQATAASRLAALALEGGRIQRAVVLDCDNPERLEILMALARRQPDLHLLGVEATPVGLDHARGVLEEAGLSGRIELELAQTRGLLTLEEQCCDLIVAEVDSLQEGELARLLRPGGRALLREPHGWSLLRPVGVPFAAYTEDEGLLEAAA